MSDNCVGKRSFVVGTPPTYGTPDPRKIRPLVRINAQTQDMPVGYVLPGCILPMEEIAAATNQKLSIEGNVITLSGNGDSVTLPVDLDAQTLTLTGTTLAISGGNSVDLAPLIPTDLDEQTLTLVGTTLAISGGNSIDLSAIIPVIPADLDEQTLTLTGTVLAISNGNSVDLAALAGGSAVAGDTSKLLELSVAQLTTPAGATQFTPVDITGMQNSVDAAFATVDAATNTITFAAHTKPIIVELTVNAVFHRQTGGVDLDAGICLRESTGGGIKAFILCQGRNAGEDYVQASGTAMFEVLPAETARTYTLTAVTQSSGTWTLKGFLGDNPLVTIKVTKT